MPEITTDVNTCNTKERFEKCQQINYLLLKYIV